MGCLTWREPLEDRIERYVETRYPKPKRIVIHPDDKKEMARILDKTIDKYGLPVVMLTPRQTY